MKSILLAILSGLLLIPCFPKFDLGFLAWFALVPLLIAIKDKSLKSSFGLCFFTGIFFYGGVFYWFKLVKHVSLIDFTSVVIYLSICYFGFFGLSLNLIIKKTRIPSIVTAPVLWVTLEYGRSYAGFVAHPQMLMGHSQYFNLPIIQISSFTGVYGISFLIIMVNVAISDVIHDWSKALKPIIATITVLGISLTYGLSIITSERGSENISITIVQGNISPEDKWKPKFREQHINKHILLTKNTLENNINTSLIVWPEAAIQGSFRKDLYYVRAVSTLVKDTKIHLLFGSSQNPKYGSSGYGTEKMFNSAFMVSPAGKIVGQYNKIHLLPFAEYLPYKGSFPWPSRFVSNAGNFIPGDEYTIFNLDGARFGVTICWENIYPELFRQFVKRGANFMINITNEARLGDTSAPYQFAAISTFRAVENGVSVVRSGNTGVSCFVDPCGRIIGKVHDHNNKETFIEGYLTMNVPLSYERTFYTRYGDVFIYLNLFAAVFMIGLSFFRRKKEVLTQSRRGR